MELEHANITLISEDRQSFDVPMTVAQISGFINNALGDEKDTDTTVEIQVLKVKGDILKKVIEFCTHHQSEPMKEIEKPLKSANMSEIVQQFYADFVNVEQPTLYEMILAANYMDIKPLLELTCAAVASRIKGKTPEEIRKTFHIVDDFTPEEEALIHEESKNEATQ